MDVKYSNLLLLLLLLVISIVLFSPWVSFWQEPERSQATGMAQARCILGKFRRIDCHCISLPLDVPPFEARSHQVPNVSASSSEWWNFGREWDWDMGLTAFLHLWRKACWGFFARVRGDRGFEHANAGTRSQHVNDWTTEASIIN
jgi:hypothetical protein